MKGRSFAKELRAAPHFLNQDEVDRSFDLKSKATKERKVKKGFSMDPNQSIYSFNQTHLNHITSIMSAGEPAFNRPALEQLLGKRFFYAPAFSLYGGKEPQDENKKWNLNQQGPNQFYLLNKRKIKTPGRSDGNPWTVPIVETLGCC